MKGQLSYMHMAYRLALKGQGRTSPNPLVGAVIVKSRKVIAQGWHKHCGADHAEIMALKRAGLRAKGASLFVTLEPCSHFGRTPPCVDAIIASGIRQVYVGTKDPNPLVNGRSLEKMRRAGIEVHVGFMRKELEQMNEFFIKYIKHGMPFVVAKIAQTMDGKVATASGVSKWITSSAARRYAKTLRGHFDAILVGANTAVADDPGLNVLNKNSRIKKILLDSRLKIPLQAKLFQRTRPEDCIVATTPRADRKKIDLFRRKGVQVVVCPQREGKVDMRWLFKALAGREVTSILIEGGSAVVSEALRSGLIDKMNVYIAPKIMGDEKALSAVRGLKAKDLAQLVRLENIAVKNIGNDILVEGYVHRDR